MRLKSIEINGDKFIMGCIKLGDGLKFYGHNEAKMIGYAETLSAESFELRMRELNNRVKFPADVVRSALTADDPTLANFVGSEAGESLVLRYRIEGAPLKWQWQLERIPSSMFYWSLVLDSVNTATLMHDLVLDMSSLLQKKDIEIKQYKDEGAKLRRITVATERFDVDTFKAENEELLADALAYQQLCRLHNATELANVKRRAVTPELKPKVDLKSTSPRNRKRKALEIGTNHLERKVLQRRQAPQMRYRDTQSQEDIEAYFTENCMDAAADTDTTKAQHDDISGGSCGSLNLRFSDEEHDAAAVAPSTSHSPILLQPNGK